MVGGQWMFEELCCWCLMDIGGAVLLVLNGGVVLFPGQWMLEES